jgi:RNA polymerase sigma-70 factor (ECF subfamily)
MPIGVAVMDQTSASLLERLRRPNQPDAWQQFADLYTPLLYYWLRRQGVQQADAADLVQEVFLTLVQKLPAFAYDPGRSFRNWLRTVTLNKLRERRRQAVPVQAAEGALDAVADDGPDDPFWETEYRQQLVQRTLTALRGEFQPATWEAFWRHAVQGRPAPEVAAELGLKAGAVRAARFRVVSRLRQELAGLLD